MSVVVGVDSSTQSYKVELRALENGALLGRGSASHPPAHSPRSEQDPAAWWEAFKKALRRAVDQSGVSRQNIRAISIAAQCHGLVALDETGATIRPVKLWNDTESAKQLQHLREKIGAQHWIESVGSLPTAAFTLSKITWLAENEPSHFQRMRRICLPHDWLTLQLCGQHVTDRSEASGTGYYNARTDQYISAYLELINPDRDWMPLLPRVFGPNEAAGRVDPKIADSLGLAQDVLIGPAGDQHAAALGLDVKEGDVAYVLGTSGVVFTTSANPVADLDGVVDGVSDCTGGYLPLVSTLNATRVTEWAGQMLNVGLDELGRLALSADPYASPSFAAFMEGERKPNRPDACGVLAELTSSTTRADLARAAHEGVLMALTRGEKRINAAGEATGGRVILDGRRRKIHGVSSDPR
ncbi:MAG: FGGY family carbohydrate kinase [Acetobacteraceae bacterium]